MSCRCVKYHSFGITVFEISDGRCVCVRVAFAVVVKLLNGFETSTFAVARIYISEPRCGRDFWKRKPPLHRLVRQLRSSSLDQTSLEVYTYTGRKMVYI